MVENSRTNRIGLWPARFGVASLIAACLAWGSVWLLFNMGPDSILNNRLYEAIAIGLLPLFGFACGLFGVGAGFREKNWAAVSTGAFGLTMIGFEALFLLMNR